MRKSILWGIGIYLLLTLVISDIALAISVEDVINSFRKKYEKTSNFTADFEQTTFVAGKKRVANGDLSFQKPNLLRQRYFDLSNPEGMTQLIVSDGQTLWSYTPLINQITKQKIMQHEKGAELLPGFGRSLENVEKNYSITLVEDKLAEKRGVHVVELVPKNGDQLPDHTFDVLQVWIRDEDSVPVQFMYRSKKNEMTFILSFKNVKVNENLDEFIFKFEVPKGVQVITVPEQ